MDIGTLEKSVFRKLISNPPVLVKYIHKLSEEDFSQPLIKTVMGAFFDNSAVISQYVPSVQYFQILLRDRIHDPKDLEHAANVIAGLACTPIDHKDIDILIRELKANRMCRSLTQIVQKSINNIKPESVEDAYNEMLKDLLQLPLTASSGR